MIDAAILTTLIPGSVWRREIRKQGKEPRISEVTVLAISNQTSSPKVLEEHPAQVLFVTEGGELLTQDIEFFVRRRTYVTLNEDVAAAMTTTIGLCFPADEEVEDFDQVELSDASTEIALQEVASGDLEDTPLEGETAGDDTQVFPFQVIGEHPLSQLLSEGFVSYTEGPPTTTGELLHTLKFSLDELTLEDLVAVFVTEQVPFTLTSWGSTLSFESSQPLSVGQEIRGSSAYAVVYLLTKEVTAKDQAAELKIFEETPPPPPAQTVTVVDTVAAPVAVQVAPSSVAPSPTDIVQLG